MPAPSKREPSPSARRVNNLVQHLSAEIDGVIGTFHEDAAAYDRWRSRTSPTNQPPLRSAGAAPSPLAPETDRRRSELESVPHARGSLTQYHHFDQFLKRKSSDQAAKMVKSLRKEDEEGFVTAPSSPMKAEAPKEKASPAWICCSCGQKSSFYASLCEFCKGHTRGKCCENVHGEDESGKKPLLASDCTWL